MNDLTYINTEGDTVFTSQYLKNRGSCCKTNCLHCPFGFTLKNHGLIFKEVTDDLIPTAQKFIDSQNDSSSDLTASLLASAFGPAKKKTIIDQSNKSDYQLVYLKDVLCALVKKGTYQATELILGPHFNDQGLSLDVINSQIEKV